MANQGRLTIGTYLSKSYFGWTVFGYSHFTVNHSQNLVETLTVTFSNSQTIIVDPKQKKSLKTGIRSDCLADHLAEYLYTLRPYGNKPYH